MFKDITIQELRSMNDNNHTIVDVRSPKEYNEATIPGSVNIPVFNNAERVEIGTLYKRVNFIIHSPCRARVSKYKKGSTSPNLV